jgi:hypothetical protein
MTDSVTVTVDWTPQLLGAGAKAFQKRQQRKLGWKVPALLFLGLVLVILGVFQLTNHILQTPEHDIASFRAGRTTGYAQSVVYLIFFFVTIIVLTRLHRGQFYTDSPIFERSWTVALSVSGFRTRGPYTQGHTEWAAVVDVLETKTATIISLGAGGFVPLPNAGLPEGVTQAELLRRIDAWRAAADF